MKKVTLFWFRRDLRLKDNIALFYALKSETPVLPLFIFDKEILNVTESSKDGRVEFIHNQLQSINKQLKKYSSSLLVLHGNPIEQFKLLLEKYDVAGLHFNRDYEPYAQKRDSEVTALFNKKGIDVHSFKDQVIFEKDDILKKDGKPYTVFTPYKRKWMEAFSTLAIKNYQTEPLLKNCLQVKPFYMPELQNIGFKKTNYDFPTSTIDEEIIKNYHQNRDYPHLDGTTRLGLHFRFGTISIRNAVKKAYKLSQTWLNELVWREFYMMILWHFPKVVDHSFKQKYDMIPWRNDEQEFNRWRHGQTGYPIVDAGMRELNETGYMHNRVRMITASFLTKHLLIDWRWGEAYFAEKLLDYELASNNGGWQWAAGSGCDAAPYFRIFNPDLQTKRFDPEHAYIRKWVPEYKSNKYPEPIVEHKFARERALEEYKRTLKND
mgnify:CR=1 FL=1